MLFVGTDVIRAGSCRHEDLQADLPQAHVPAPGTCTCPSTRACLRSCIALVFLTKPPGGGNMGKASGKRCSPQPSSPGHPRLQSWAPWRDPVPWAGRIVLSWVPATFPFTSAQRAAKYPQQKGEKSPPMACNILSSLKKHLGQSRLF